MARPTSVVVIGVGWLLISIMMFMSALFGLVVFFVFGAPPEPSGEPGEMPSLVLHFGLTASLQVLGAVAVGMASVGVLKLRDWGRRLMVICCWLGLVLLSVVLLVQIAAMFGLVGGAGVAEGVVLLLFVLGSFAMALLIASIPGLTIWALGRPHVRDKFA